VADKSSNLSTLASNIKEGVDARLKELHTSLPGIIETFDSETQTASVQPAIKRIFKTHDGEKEILIPEDLPLLINVPVKFPRGGGYSVTLPVKKGDECLLTFCERSIDNWYKFGGINLPGSRRFHSLSDAVVEVGLSSSGNLIPNFDTDNLQIKKDDGSVEITLLSDGTMKLKGTTITLDGDVVVTGDASISGDTTITKDLTAKNVTGNTEVTVGIIGLSTHIHSTPSGPSGPPTAPP